MGFERQHQVLRYRSIHQQTKRQPRTIGWHYAINRILTTLKLFPTQILKCALLALSISSGTCSAQELIIVQVVQLGSQPQSQLQATVFVPTDPTPTALRLEAGIAISPGTEILLPRGVRLVLTDDQNNRYTIEPNSRFRVHPSTGESSLLNVIAGSVLVKVRNALDFFGLRHERIIASVRGTEFQLSVSPERGVDINVLEGKVRIRRPLSAIVQGDRSNPNLTLTDLVKQNDLSTNQSIFVPSMALTPTLEFPGYSAARRYFERAFFDSLGKGDAGNEFDAIRNLMTIYHRMALPDAVIGLTPACLAAATASAMPASTAVCLNKRAAAQSTKGNQFAAVKTLSQAASTLDQAGVGELDSLRSALWNNLGRAHLKLGDPVTSSDHLTQALSIALRVNGAIPHPDTARILHNLSVVSLRLSELDTAKTAAEQALSMRQILHPSEAHSSIAQSFATLGAIHAARGNVTEGISLNERAVSIWKTLHPNHDHPDLLLSLTRLGTLHESKSAYDLATEYFRQAAGLGARLAGRVEAESRVAPVLGLGRVFAMAGQLDAAQRELGLALEIAQKSLPKSHPTTIAALQAGATIDFRRGNYHRAAEKFKEVLQQLPDPKNDQAAQALARAWNNLGISQRADGRAQAAIHSHSQALAIRRGLPEARRSLPVAQSLTNLARAKVDQGSFDLSLRHIAEALDLLEQLYPNDNSEMIAIALSARVEALKGLGRLHDALASVDRSLKIRERIFQGKNHPALAFSLAQRGHILLLSGSPEQALKSQQRALAMMENVYPPTGHPDWVDTLLQTARTLENLDKASHAQRIREKANKMRTHLTDHATD